MKQQDKYPWEGDPQAALARAEQRIRMYSEAPDPIELPRANADVRQTLKSGNRKQLQEELGALQSEVEGPVGPSPDLTALGENTFQATAPTMRPTEPLRIRE